MSKYKHLVLCGIVCMTAASAVAAESVTRRGNSVMHYMTKTAVSAPETVPGASGVMRIQENAQGNSSKQTMDLSITGLAPDQTYTLAAVLGEDPNSVAVGTVTTSSKGTVRLKYSGKGKKAALPELLDPLTNVRAISLVSNDVTIAYAWVAESSTYQVLVKRNLTPADPEGTAAGSISLKANAEHVNFKLLAGGLAASTEYKLALNSTVVATATTDADGRLTITEWPATAPAALDLRSLELRDGADAVVLSTGLPE
jgi:hypothetical protein